jgi:hypothetical protein
MKASRAFPDAAREAEDALQERDAALDPGGGWIATGTTVASMRTVRAGSIARAVAFVTSWSFSAASVRVINPRGDERKLRRQVRHSAVPPRDEVGVLDNPNLHQSSTCTITGCITRADRASKQCSTGSTRLS